jgi:exodeoxyribonuclease VII small subunit
MSKATKTSAAGGVAGADLPFEEALKQLESIVAAMEAGDLPLEAMLERYEAGTKVEICQAKLAAAEVKLQQLEKGAEGALSLTPLAAGTTEAA